MSGTFVHARQSVRSTARKRKNLKPIEKLQEIVRTGREWRLCRWRHRRHTTAMHLLQSGVDISVIALSMGHESPSTTHHYVVADLAMKDRALARLQEPDEMIHRYHAPDSLLAFLKTLELM